jgi:hypothetical protein
MQAKPMPSYAPPQMPGGWGGMTGKPVSGDSGDGLDYYRRNKEAFDFENQMRTGQFGGGGMPNIMPLPNGRGSGMQPMPMPMQAPPMGNPYQSMNGGGNQAPPMGNVMGNWRAQMNRSDAVNPQEGMGSPLFAQIMALKGAQNGRR